MDSATFSSTPFDFENDNRFGFSPESITDLQLGWTNPKFDLVGPVVLRQREFELKRILFEKVKQGLFDTSQIRNQGNSTEAHNVESISKDIPVTKHVKFETKGNKKRPFREMAQPGPGSPRKAYHGPAEPPGGIANSKHLLRNPYKAIPKPNIPHPDLLSKRWREAHTPRKPNTSKLGSYGKKSLAKTHEASLQLSIARERRRKANMISQHKIPMSAARLMSGYDVSGLVPMGDVNSLRYKGNRGIIEDLDDEVCSFCERQGKRKMATRLCYSCAKYEPKGKGLCCDNCFSVQHPWHRVPHQWVPVDSAERFQNDWKLQVTKLERERMRSELNQLLLHVEAVHAEARDDQDEMKTAQQSISENQSEEHLIHDVNTVDPPLLGIKQTIHRIRTAIHTYDRAKATIKSLAPLLDREYSRDEAAQMIQNMFFTWKARRRLRYMVQTTYVKVYDESAGSYYYYNTKTGTMSWQKPPSVDESQILTPRTHNKQLAVLTKKLENRFKRANAIPEEEAARMIQNKFRARKLQAHTKQELLKSYYRKILEPNSNRYYYLDLRTGLSSWNRPRFLSDSDEDIPVYSTNDQSKTKNKKSQLQRKRSVNHTWTQLEAAKLIQGLWRTKLARRKLYLLICSAYEKIVDPNSNRVYFHNKITGVSQWSAPKLLVLADNDSWVAKHKRRTGRKRSISFQWTEVEAAVCVQGLWRTRNARRQMRKLLEGLFEKVLDPTSGKYFYFNSKTGESSWEKPKLLGNADIGTTERRNSIAVETGNDLKLGRRRSSGHVWTDLEAAICVQGLWRTRNARRQMRKLLEGLFEKVLDPTSGKYFYFNSKTGESSWEKPKLLGNADIGTTERRNSIAVETGNDLKLGRRRSSGHVWTDLEAAICVQGLWRTRNARRQMRKLLEGLFEKVLDPTSGKYFYFNSKTGESSWEKPKLLGNADIGTTERRNSIAVETGNDLKLGRRRSSGHVWTDLEAAICLQGLWRTRKARHQVHMLLNSIFRKVLDPESGDYFYFNSKTGESSWDKPKLLGSQDINESGIEHESTEEVEENTNRKRRRSSGHVWTDLEAATCVQGLWRTRNARRQMRKLLEGLFEKVLDPTSGKYFYFNSKTGESSWEKPKLLGNADIGTTERRNSIAVETGNDLKLGRRRSSGHVWTDLEAAICVQGLWRTRNARRQMRKLLEGLFEKVLDPTSGKYFYFNSKTGESSWEKPKLLGNADIGTTERRNSIAVETGNDLKLGRRRSSGHVWTDLEAAICVQGLWRTRKARHQVHMLLNSIFRKVLDPESGDYFYFNSKTGESSWDKPKLLGSQDINESGIEHESTDEVKDNTNRKRRRSSGHVWTDLEAAICVQGLWRTRKARHQVHMLLNSIFRKVLDPESGDYFYFNSKTGESSWDKPKLLGSQDINEDSVAKQSRARFENFEWSESSAIICLQSMFRSCIARQRVRERILEVFHKSKDEESGYDYYYNTMSGESSWEPPLLSQRILVEW